MAKVRTRLNGNEGRGLRSRLRARQRQVVHFLSNAASRFDSPESLEPARAQQDSSAVETRLQQQIDAFDTLDDMFDLVRNELKGIGAGTDAHVCVNTTPVHSDSRERSHRLPCSSRTHNHYGVRRGKDAALFAERG
jgi:hypothetical protein